MAILKCKMCGGDLAVTPDMTVATCQYCGSAMTLPKDADERKANLYNRANHFRINCDFDKAASVYESILNEDNTEAEAHWGLVLCKYGIEYVEDPRSHERIPTCHRTSFGSVLKDADYLSAIQYADFSAREIYEKEAAHIDGLQREILALSAKEEPYDIFICYKETDAYGKRTEDSVIAQDLYYELNKRGFKVFFARKTLEGKLGSAYEPIIFAALNSAKAMVVLGTKIEHFNAVWVKNEWSRYLGMMSNDKEKHMVPAYRDCSPYDLPVEFSHLQAQDMSKLGFMQDLCDGLEKLVRKFNPQAVVGTVVASAPAISAETLLKRANISRESGDYKTAETAYEKAIEADPENPECYWGRFLMDVRCEFEEDLFRRPELLDWLGGNLSSQGDTPYEEFLASEEYIQNLRNGSPTLGLHADYKTALRLASPEQKTHYEDINRKLVSARLELVRQGEAQRQLLRKSGVTIVISRKKAYFYCLGKVTAYLGEQLLGSVGNGKEIVSPPIRQSGAFFLRVALPGVEAIREITITKEQILSRKEIRLEVVCTATGIEIL